MGGTNCPIIQYHMTTIYDTVKGLYILCELAYVLIVWVSIPCQLYHLIGQAGIV